MFNVYFENRFEERIFLAEVENEEMIYQTIKQDISERAQPSFQWHYTRSWTRDNGEKVYDCGSWCEFYIAVPVENVEKKNQPNYLPHGGVKMNQDFLREKIIEYVNQTGVKKKYIASCINETPENFSRWLTKKRNYGEQRENQIIDFLISRGVLDGETIN